MWHFFDFLTMHILKGHNFLISNPSLTILNAMNEPKRDLQLFLDTINKGTLLWISSSFEFLCVWTLGYFFNTLVNNKTSSLLDFSSDGTTSIIIANIYIANLGIANIGLANLGIVNIRITKISLVNLGIANS